MGDGDDRALVLGQVLLEPGDRLGVEVVGRLVEQQQVGRGEQQPAQGDAAPLAAGEVRRPPASAGGRRSASIAVSIRVSRFQPSTASIWSCRRANSSAVSSE